MTKRSYPIDHWCGQNWAIEAIRAYSGKRVGTEEIGSLIYSAEYEPRTVAVELAQRPLYEEETPYQEQTVKDN